MMKQIYEKVLNIICIFLILLSFILLFVYFALPIVIPELIYTEYACLGVLGILLIIKLINYFHKKTRLIVREGKVLKIKKDMK